MNYLSRFQQAERQAERNPGRKVRFPSSDLNCPTTAETVLVVDGYSALTEMLKVILGIVGYRVVGAESAVEAAKAMREEAQIDLLLCDPEVRGTKRCDVIGALERHHPGAALVLMGNPAQRPLCGRPFRFLAKPFNMVDVREVVRQALRERIICAPERKWAA